MGDMSAAIGAPEAERPLRADAARNRTLILKTAAEVFAEQGLDAGYEEIARRAGIGVGTVYRRFPERDELVQALFQSRIEEIVTVARQALTMPSWEGLVWFLERAVERQVADRGLKEVMVRAISPDDHRAFGRECLTPLLDELVDRAQADGVLRQDVTATDLGMHLLVLSSMSTPAVPELWRRYLALFVDGLRARPDLSSLTVRAPKDECMQDLMSSLQGRPVC